MKLRNKPEYIGEEKPKGRVGTLIGYSDSHKAIVVEFEGEDGGAITTFYHSLAELNEEWEDYAPKEPLIKDEKIRKIIRLWAEVNNSNKLFIGCDWNAIDEEDYMIEFADDNVFDFPAGHYTIAELCGEEDNEN